MLLSFLFRPTPSAGVSDSILVVTFLCSPAYSMSPLAPPPPVYDPFFPVDRKVLCLSGRSMLPLRCHKRVRVFPFPPPTPRGVFVPWALLSRIPQPSGPSPLLPLCFCTSSSPW
eukprot:5517080-Pleurochrysis_carterae.AAC.3